MANYKRIENAVNRFITGDCETVMKRLPAESVDFVLTSPPYADKRDYGLLDGMISPDDYVDWFMPKGKQIYRVLKENGSFVLQDAPTTRFGTEFAYSSAKTKKQWASAKSRARNQKR